MTVGDVISKEKETNIKIKKKLHLSEIHPDLFAYMFEQECKPKFPGVKKILHGYVRKENLPKTVTCPKRKEDGTHLMINVSIKYLDTLRDWGWAGDYLHKLFDTETSLAPFITYGSKQFPLIIQLDHSCHMAFDIDGNVLPVAVYFNYIEAQLDNKNYDLKKVESVLSKRSDIHFLKEDGVGSYSYREDKGKNIQPIPYYNAEPCEGRTHFLPFIWRPTQKDYTKMWKECLSLGGTYPSTNKYRAIWKLDLLGYEKHRKPESRRY